MNMNKTKNIIIIKLDSFNNNWYIVYIHTYIYIYIYIYINK